MSAPADATQPVPIMQIGTVERTNFMMSCIESPDSTCPPGELTSGSALRIHQRAYPRTRWGIGGAKNTPHSALPSNLPPSDAGHGQDRPALGGPTSQECGPASTATA